MSGIIRGIMERICVGLSPCCEAYVTIPAMTRIPVMPTRESKNTLTSSKKIVRLRMLQYTPASLPEWRNDGTLGSSRERANCDASRRLGDVFFLSACPRIRLEEIRER